VTLCITPITLYYAQTPLARNCADRDRAIQNWTPSVIEATVVSLLLKTLGDVYDRYFAGRCVSQTLTIKFKS